ncbi:hypothetical protein D7Y13_05840 [Corallococcus praedator]|uniref:Lipoprotein n=1 Tax=Corallococcus praedator TaxID=2316724 RepID=A0ABX9QNH9_9BACT|nr:hypothetical protein D7X75_07205 [Corallococcus sp. CA031C]RKI14616.1 hypothetical protein D7Y13_05840 [Corallococcus praedator]
MGALVGLAASACQETEDLPAPCDGAPGQGLLRAFEHCTPSSRVEPRANFGGLKVRKVSGRTLVLETARDVEGRASRRLMVRDAGGAVLWHLDEAAGEHFSDFTVHPSGEATLGVERTDAASGAFDLVRLSAEGRVLSRQPLPTPATVPPSDLDGTLLPSPFRMRSLWVDALTTAGCARRRAARTWPWPSCRGWPSRKAPPTRSNWRRG